MRATDPTEQSVSDISLQQCDDSELLDLFRRGHPNAYATLFARYRYAARRLALHLGQREEADDVVSESFAQVLGLLRRGKGPQTAFRAYLFTTIRHESGRRAKARKRVTPTVDAMIDSAVPFGAGRLDNFETSAIRAAYTSLPDRWRLVLWHVDVEGRKPHELSDAMAMSANGISALAYRARAGLRDAYLQQHVGSSAAVDAVHAEIRMTFAGVVRRTASQRDRDKVNAHLADCPACMVVFRELEETNRHIGAIALPAAMTASVAGIAGTAAVKTGVVAQWGALGGKLVSACQVATATATAAVAGPVAVVAVTTSVAAAVVVGVDFRGTEEQVVGTVAAQSAPTPVRDQTPGARPPSASLPEPHGPDAASTPTLERPTTQREEKEPAERRAPAPDAPRGAAPSIISVGEAAVSIDKSGVQVRLGKAKAVVPLTTIDVDVKDLIEPVTTTADGLLGTLALK